MSTSSSKKVIFAALLGNSLIAITKFVAASISGSSAMVSEGIHSLVDTGIKMLLLYGMRAAQKPADQQHPFGHGKEIYFWSFAVAIMIFAIGAGVSIYEGVLHIIEPAPLKDPLINYIVLGFAILFEGAAWLFAMKEFSKAKGEFGYIEAVRRGKDPTMFAVVFEDSAALLGLLVALVGISLGQATGNVYLDGIASLIIGLILGFCAIWLAYESKSLLIGESANAHIVQSIREQLNETPGWRHINEISTMHMGPDYVLLAMSLDFEDQLSAGDVEDVVAEISRSVKQRHPQIKRVYIEAREKKAAPVTHS